LAFKKSKEFDLQPPIRTRNRFNSMNTDVPNGKRQLQIINQWQAKHGDLSGESSILDSANRMKTLGLQERQPQSY
jgi:hypothetical protein